MELITGVTWEDAVDRQLLDVFLRLEHIGDHNSLKEALSKEMTIAKESSYALGDGDLPVFFEIHFSPLRNEIGNRVGGVAFFRNITERKLAERALKDLSIRDLPTNLYNRRYFNKRIIIAEGIESEEKLAVAAQIGIHLVQGYLFGKPAPINLSRPGSSTLSISVN